jgi:hypothetical protein
MQLTWIRAGVRNDVLCVPYWHVSRKFNSPVEFISQKQSKLESRFLFPLWEMSNGFSKKAFKPITDFIIFILSEVELFQFCLSRPVKTKPGLGSHILLTATSESVVSMYGNVYK